MTERVALGASDVVARWRGLSRPQALGAAGAVGALADAALRTHGALEAAAGLVVLAAVLPLAGATLGGWALIAARYVARRHWLVVRPRERGAATPPGSRAIRAVRAASLVQRGRLDLTGQDRRLAGGVGALAESLATGGGGALTWHVHRTSARDVTTVLAADSEVVWPAGWRADASVAARVVGARDPIDGWLERWDYLRREDGVMTVLRVGQLDAGGHHAALAALQGEGDTTVSVHLEVLGTARGRRQVERAAHRDGSERAVARAAGFRDTARAARVATRARQCEREVAEGRALGRLAILVVVRAERLASLRAARRALLARARAAGLRLERGGGRQATWLAASWPGSAPRACATHWATSADLEDLRLPAHDAGTGVAGGTLGVVAGGAPFRADPFDLYEAGIVANPNVVVAGAIGTGKSTVVKMLLARALERGRRVVVVDPKGEYGALASAAGVAPVRLGVDGWCDPFDGAEDPRALVRAVVGAALGGPLSPEQLFDLDEAWRGVGPGGAARPLRALARQLRDARTGGEPGRRALALTLHRLVEGDLAGLFDGEGPALRLAGPLTVLDLSAQWSSSALGVAALSAVAAAQRVAQSPRPGYVALDEAWALLGDDAALTWLRGSWKLARARGLSHLLVVHRWGDVSAVGDAGSARRERARGLLRECETTWLLRQPTDEAADIAAALDLSAREVAALTALRRGEALVRYGPHRSLVRVRPGAADRDLIDTDQAMRA